MSGGGRSGVFVWMLRDLRQKLFSGDDLRLLDKLVSYWAKYALPMNGADAMAGKEFISQDEFRAGFERFGISYSTKDWLDFEIHFEDPDDDARLDFRQCAATILGELSRKRQTQCDHAAKKLRKHHRIQLSALMWCLRDSAFVKKTENYVAYVHGVTADDDEGYAGAIDNVERTEGGKEVSDKVKTKVKKYMGTGQLKGEYTVLRRGLKKKKKKRDDDDDDDDEEDEEEEDEEEEEEEEMEAEDDEDDFDEEEMGDAEKGKKVKAAEDDDATDWDESIATADIDMKLWGSYCVSMNHSMPDDEAFAVFIDLLTRHEEVKKKEKAPTKKREYGPIRDTIMDIKPFAIQWPTTQTYNSKATQHNRADPADFMNRKAPGAGDGLPGDNAKLCSTVTSTANLWEHNKQQIIDHKVSLRGRLYDTRARFFEIAKGETMPGGVQWWYNKEKRLHQAVVAELEAKRDAKDAAVNAQSWFQRRQNASMSGASEGTNTEEEDLSEDVEDANRKKPNFQNKECVCTVKAWTFAAVADTLFRRDPYRVLTKQVVRELGYHNRAENWGTGFAFNFCMNNKQARDHQAAKKHMDRIRGDTAVLKLIQGWWEMLVPWNTGQKELSREQYIRWNMRMFHALVGNFRETKWGNAKQIARKVAITDWEFDFVQEKGRMHGIRAGYIDNSGDTMSKVQFRESVLRLADMWIPTATPDDYISFLRGLEVWVPADPILLGTEQEPGPAHFHIKQWPAVEGGQNPGFDKLHETMSRDPERSKPIEVPGPGMYFSQTMGEKTMQQAQQQEHLNRVRQTTPGMKAKRRRKPQAVHLCDPDYTMLRNGEGQGASFGQAGKNQDPVDPRWLADPAFVGGALNVTGPGELGGGGLPGPVRARETKYQDKKIRSVENWKMRETRKGAIEKEKAELEATQLADARLRRSLRHQSGRQNKSQSSTQQSIMGGSGTLYLGPDPSVKMNTGPTTAPSITAARRMQEKLGLTMLDAQALSKIKNPQTYELLVRYLQKVQSLPVQQQQQEQYYASLPSATAPAYPASASADMTNMMSPINTERPRTAPTPIVRNTRSPTEDLDDGYNHKPAIQTTTRAQSAGRSKTRLPPSPTAQKAKSDTAQDRPSTAPDVLARRLKNRPSSMVEDFQRKAHSSALMPEITKVMSVQMGKAGHMDKALGVTKSLHAQLSSSYSRVHDMTNALSMGPKTAGGSTLTGQRAAGRGAGFTPLVPSRLTHGSKRMASATQKQSQSQPFVPRPGKEPDRGIIESMLLQRKAVQSR
jgi:hypothetical protein